MLSGDFEAQYLPKYGCDYNHGGMYGVSCPTTQ